MTEKGSVLTNVIFFVTLLTLIGLTMVTFVQNNSSLATSAHGRAQGFYTAQAGMEWAIARSMSTGNWHWSGTYSNVAGGSVTVTAEDSTVIGALNDTLQITVTSTTTSGASKQKYRTRLVDISYYAVYISGDMNDKLTINDSDGTDNPARAFEGATELPEIDITKLQQMAVAQGHYFPGSYSMGNSEVYPTIPDTGFFHVRPNGVPSDSPNVVFIEGDLEVKNGAQISGIIVVQGDVSLKNSQKLQGVLYLPNPVSVVEQEIDLHNKETVIGGIIGGANITGLGNANKINVVHRQSYLSWFYGQFSPTGLPYVTLWRNWREF